MKRLKLITALNAAIDALQTNSVHYNWWRTHSCNCGIVAQAIIGKTSKELQKDIEQMRKGQTGTAEWSNLTAAYCPITGTPQNEIFRSLLESGMTRKELVELEYLSNEKIFVRAKINRKEVQEYLTLREQKVIITPAGLFRKEKSRMSKVEITESGNQYFYAVKSNLIKYLKAWVEILNEEQEPEAKEAVVKPDTSLKAELNELKISLQ